MMEQQRSGEIVAVEAKGSSFLDRVPRLLERLEYRRADTVEEKRAIHRLRHKAYTRAGTVALPSSGIFDDSLDESPNAYMIGLFIDGDLSASLRLHIAASPSAETTTRPVFRDIVDPLLERRLCIVDVSRFSAELEASREFPELPYLTLRTSFLATEYFGSDYITAGCLYQHRAFYMRMFGFVEWTKSPRSFPGFNLPMAFLGYDCKNMREKTLSRYPFFHPKSGELEQLFHRTLSGGVDLEAAIGRRELFPAE